MPGQHRRAQALTEPLALIAGGTAGALVRYALVTTWPHPRQQLLWTVVTVGVAFAVAAAVLASRRRGSVSSFVLGLCASAASLSGWAVLTISTAMKLSLAFLVLTPAAAIAGLLCGLVVARAVAR